MKALLDENIPHDLRAFLARHETFTVAYLGWDGLKNGKLLDAAESAGFDVLVTGDKTLEYEQSLTHRRIALVALSAMNWPVIEPHMASVIDLVDRAGPGTLTRVDCGAFSRHRPKPELTWGLLCYATQESESPTLTIPSAMTTIVKDEYTSTQRRVIDARLNNAAVEIKKGHVSPAFGAIEEFAAAIQADARKLKGKTKRSARR